MQFIVHNIWWFILALLLVSGIGGYLFLFTGLRYRVLDWIKPDSEKYIRAKIFCEDRQIRDRKLRVGRYCIQDDKRRMGWHLAHALLIKSHETGKRFLCLSERDSFPLDFHGKLSKDIISQYPKARRIFLDSTADIRSQSAKAASSNIMASSLSLIAVAGALIFVIMAIIVFWRGGNIGL